MKTKIFVSSISGIEYIPHQAAITSIPDRIFFSDIEEYDDQEELAYDSFYTRIKFDSNDVKVLPARDKTISLLIDQAINNSYDSFLFILPPKKIIDYEEALERIMADRPSLHIHVYYSNQVSYPLSYVAQEAERQLRKGASFSTMESVLFKLEENMKMYFYSPVEDVLSSELRVDLIEDIAKLDTRGDNYLYDNEGLKLQKKSKKVLPLVKLLDDFLGDISSVSVIPFVLYTNKNSLYNKLILSKILESYPRLKKIREIPIPPALGIVLGKYSVGVGYIVKEDSED
jgi:fatty acid-binding protein DegV